MAFRLCELSKQRVNGLETLHGMNKLYEMSKCHVILVFNRPLPAIQYTNTYLRIVALFHFLTYPVPRARTPRLPDYITKLYV